MGFVWKELLPVVFAPYTTTERDAIADPPNNLVIFNVTTNRLEIFSVGEQWMDFLHYYGTATSEEIPVWNATEEYWEPKSPAEYLAMLSEEAAAGFDWGGQNLTNIGNVGIADDDLVEIDDSNVTVGEFAQFTADGLKGEPAGTGDYNLVRIDHEEGVEEGDFPRFTEDGVEPRTPVELLQDLSGIADDPFDWNDQELRNVRSVDTDTINESTGGAGVTIDGVKLKDDTALIDANSATALLVEQDGVNDDVLLVNTATPRVTINAELDINHTAAENDDHAVEIDVDAAGYGDIKGLDIAYITGAISAGEDEGIILINIDEIAAAGGDVFALEVLATEGDAGVYGMKTGVGIGPVHQDSGAFANPTTGTDNTTGPADVAAMIDGSSGTTTAIFEAKNEYILIGAAAAFEEIEFILTTGASGAGIKPTFWYSTAGAHQFTQFSPVDGTGAFRNTGVVAWDASDLTGHTTNDDTGTFDIKIIRTRASLSTSPVLGYAKGAATTEYVWDKDGKLTVANLDVASNIVVGGTVDGVDIAARDHAEAHEPESHNSTDITGAELEDLSDGGETALHSHAGGGGGDGVETIPFLIDGGGAAITTGVKGPLMVEFACTINQVTLLADQSGAIKIDLWVDTYANYPPTNADTITGGNEPEIAASGVKDQDSTLTSWTTSLSAGDIIFYNVDSCATITWLLVTLKVTRT